MKSPARKHYGVLSFGLAAWFVYQATMIFWMLYWVHHHYDILSPPYYMIFHIHFTGLSLEGWQVYVLATLLVLMAALFVRLGIFLISSKNETPPSLQAHE